MNQQPTPLTDQQLDDIEARAAAATDGPWHLTDAATIVAPLTGIVIADVWEPTHESANGEFIENAPTDVRALLAEVRRLRAERDEYCNRVDTLTAVAKGNKRHVQEMFQELQKAQAVLEEIRHLHKDSPMGPCPVCIDADAAAAGGDGLVPYPCPTGRLAGAQDCDPPHVREAAASAVSGAADSRPA